jgi:hypothetical protein
MTAANAEGTTYKAGTQFPKGDPAKGKGEMKEVAVFGPQNPIAHRDRRAYLIDQAAKNEAANDELQAKQVQANEKLAEIMVEALDPDRLRDETTKAALEEEDRHTPAYAAAARSNRTEILRLSALRRRGHTPEDSFIAGSAPAAASTVTKTTQVEKK